MTIVWLGGAVMAGAQEQSLVIPSPVEDYPESPQLELPDMEMPDPVQEGSEEAASEQISEDLLEPISGSEGNLYEVFPEDDECAVIGCQPALLESTGSWLRRGYWFTEVDAVIMNRQFDKNVLKLMSQEMEFTLALTTVTQTVNTPVIVPIIRRNDLFIDGGKPGAEGMPRIKIGRFLFRDQYNRDHTAEFTWYGGGQWSQQRSMEAVDGIVLEDPVDKVTFFSTLDVPDRLSHANPAFSGATSSSYSYDSRFNSFELNYHLKRRMQHDQMVMQPDGEWVRKAKPSWTRSFLAGVRFFDLTENLGWTATDVPDRLTSTLIDGQGTTPGQPVGDLEDGNYRVRTENDMYGLQVGVSQTYERARWNVGVTAKAAGLMNRIDLDSSFSGAALSDALDPESSRSSGVTHANEDTMSFLTELKLLGKWHLRPNFSFRAGMELLWVGSVGLAPYQLNFIPGGYSHIVDSTDSLYMGGSVGFEGYW
jgi:putative beta barrel porin BBP7